MKKYIILISIIISKTVFAVDFLMSNDWKIDSYKMEGGIVAWSDDEAKPLLKKRISFSDKGLKLDGKPCTGKVSKLAASEAKNLISDMKGVFCDKGNLSSDVYSIDLSCDDKIRFTPYAVKLSNGKYLGFGDGITFCLSK